MMMMEAPLEVGYWSCEVMQCEHGLWSLGSCQTLSITTVGSATIHFTHDLSFMNYFFMIDYKNAKFCRIFHY